MSSDCRLSMTPHDENRGDRHMCDGESTSCLGQAYQTTITNKSKVSVSDLCHWSRRIEKKIQKLLILDGFKVADRVYYLGKNGAMIPAHVISIDASIKPHSYEIKCDHDQE